MEKNIAALDREEDKAWSGGRERKIGTDEVEVLPELGFKLSWSVDTKKGKWDIYLRQGLFNHETE